MSLVVSALTIAGSDSSGGAGIQADLKTFSALGAYGSSVITALTAQNTRGVTGVHVVPPYFVREQLAAVLDDVRIDAVKVGMLGSAEVTRGLEEPLRELADAGVPVVIDPVMVSTSGARLLDEDATDALRQLLPLAAVITPNLAEAAALTDTATAASEAEMAAQGRTLLALGATRVLVKGGHLAGDAVDLLVTADGVERFAAPRVATTNTHGTGCSLSSALAALRPRHDDWSATVAAAKRWLGGALAGADALEIGEGHGPVHHFHRWW